VCAQPNVLDAATGAAKVCDVSPAHLSSIDFLGQVGMSYVE